MQQNQKKNPYSAQAEPDKTQYHRRQTLIGPRFDPPLFWGPSTATDTFCPKAYRGGDIETGLRNSNCFPSTHRQVPVLPPPFRRIQSRLHKFQPWTRFKIIKATANTAKASNIMIPHLATTFWPNCFSRKNTDTMTKANAIAFHAIRKIIGV